MPFQDACGDQKDLCREANKRAVCVPWATDPCRNQCSCKHTNWDQLVVESWQGRYNLGTWEKHEERLTHMTDPADFGAVFLPWKTTFPRLQMAPGVKERTSAALVGLGSGVSPNLLENRGQSLCLFCLGSFTLFDV